MSKKKRSDEELQAIADFDFHLGAMNAFMRNVRKAYETGRCNPILNHFVADVATNIVPMIGHPATQYSSLLRMYGDAVQRLANTIANCEANHPGSQCEAGMLCVAQLANSITISTHAIAAGQEIIRGRQMELDLSEED